MWWLQRRRSGEWRHSRMSGEVRWPADCTCEARTRAGCHGAGHSLSNPVLAFAARLCRPQPTAAHRNKHSYRHLDAAYVLSCAMAARLPGQSLCSQGGPVDVVALARLSATPGSDSLARCAHQPHGRRAVKPSPPGCSLMPDAPLSVTPREAPPPPASWGPCRRPGSAECLLRTLKIRRADFRRMRAPCSSLNGRSAGRREGATPRRTLRCRNRQRLPPRSRRC